MPAEKEKPLFRLQPEPFVTPVAHMQQILTRLQARAKVFGIPSDVLARIALDAMCAALEEGDCLTLPLRFRTVLPTDPAS